MLVKKIFAQEFFQDTCQTAKKRSEEKFCEYSMT